MPGTESPQTNAEKFEEVFGKKIEFLLFKVSYSYLMKWANEIYKEPEVKHEHSD